MTTEQSYQHYFKRAGSDHFGLQNGTAIGEEDCKPQPGGGANRQQQKNNKRFNKAFAKPKEVYKSPTTGLETELFRTGQPKDAADFEETVKKLA